VESADPPPTERPRAEPNGDPERYGPLELRRYVKDDGRALTLFARVAPEAEGRS
jgi:hypothetical protein